MKFDTELKLTKPFGPWMLKAKLPEEVLNKMRNKLSKTSQNIEHNSIRDIFNNYSLYTLSYHRCSQNV